MLQGELQAIPKCSWDPEIGSHSRSGRPQMPEPQEYRKWKIIPFSLQFPAMEHVVIKGDSMGVIHGCLGNWKWALEIIITTGKSW